MPLDPADRVKKSSTRRTTIDASEILNVGEVELSSNQLAYVCDVILKSGRNESIFLDTLDLTMGPSRDPVDLENGYGMIWIQPDEAIQDSAILSMTKNQVIEQALWFEKQRWRTIGGGDSTIDTYKDIELEFDPSDDRANNTEKGQNPDDHLTLVLFAFSNVSGTLVGHAGEMTYRRRKFIRLWRDPADWGEMSWEEQVSGLVF